MLLDGYLVDVEEPYNVTMTVMVSDLGVPPLSDNTSVVISVILPETGAKPPVFDADDDCANISIAEVSLFWILYKLIWLCVW